MKPTDFGSLASAVGEFLAIADAARAATSGGEVKNEQLTLVLDVNKFLGVTDWFNGEDSPRRVGWYETRLVMSDDERDQRAPDREGYRRRFWDGEVWSAPVEIDGTPEDAELAAQKDMTRHPMTIEWRGRAEPADNERGSGRFPRSTYPDTD